MQHHQYKHDVTTSKHTYDVANVIAVLVASCKIVAIYNKVLYRL